MSRAVELPTAVYDSALLNTLSVAVIGCGHVGSVVAAGLAAAGHRVLGFDISESLVAQLQAAQVPFHEPDLQATLASGIESGLLDFDTDASRLDSVQAFIVCVDTPLVGSGVELSKLLAALRTVAEAIVRSRAAVPVIVKSTTPLGTAQHLSEDLKTLTRRDIPLAVVPEFLRQGSACADFRSPERVVIGTVSPVALEVSRRLFAKPGVPVVETDPATAELIKHGANAFLATKVSLVNELSALAAGYGCDIDAVALGIGLDRRIGGRFMTPGIGFGGSCLPRDVASLVASAAAAGLQSPLLEAVLEVNANQVHAALAELRRRFGELRGTPVAVWGITFKGQTEDLRWSPALSVCQLLVKAGAVVRAHDPSWTREGSPESGMQMSDSPIRCCRNADALLVLADWKEFREVDMGEVRRAMRGRLVFDGRNCLEPQRVTAAGLDYVGVGRPFRKAAGSGGDE